MSLRSLLALAVLALTLPAAAQEEPVMDTAEALAVDARFYADAYGVTF